ncbi:hypothetical protein HWV62_43900 [Athelia sp. TMB]|nr:hypothetical protein HWV62_43900 [Athelia sp. TMB]
MSKVGVDMRSNRQLNLHMSGLEPGVRGIFMTKAMETSGLSMASSAELSAAIGILFSLLIAIYIVYASLSPRSRRARLPPGPSGWPIIGNIFDVPRSSAEWIDYRNMGEKYNSDIIYLNVLGTPIVVLNSFDAVTELLEKRAAIYSDRPHFVMVQDLMDWAGAMSLLPYGSFWRSHRRLFNCEFVTQVQGPAWHHSDLIRGVKETLHRLLESPDQWMTHLRHQASATILEIAYGIRAEKDQDPHINAAELAMRLASDALTPGKYLVDTLPWLKYVPAWVPGASFHGVAQEGKKAITAAFSDPFYEVKVAVEGNIPDQELVIKNVASIMFAAGSDTTASTFATFILAMVKYPEVQAKAQQELDTVLGPNHIPDLADKESLPYLSAIVTECFRWKVLLPFSAPHRSIADDVYKGYHIPAGALVLPNTWAVLQDESAYPDAGTFNPDRYLTEEGKLDPAVRDPEAAFGYGRRICPGRHMARESIWLTAGSILACFNIEKSVDLHGNAVEPSGNYIPGLIRTPESFPCTIKPRSKESVDLIKELS